MKSYMLNIGEICIVNQHVSFFCVGLGSCVALFIHDRVLGLSGGAHIFLPHKSEDMASVAESRAFLDPHSAIDEMLRRFRAYGSDLMTLRAKMAGGANVVSTGARIGKENAEVVTDLLIGHRIYIAAADIGGTHCRSVCFDSASGRLDVRIPATREIRTY